MALDTESNPTTIKANDDMATVAKIDELLRPISKYKKRAYCTSMTTHLPILNEIIEEMKSGARDHVSIVLLGDSMLERMTTTGLSRDAPALSCDAEWPPRHLLNYDELKTALKKRNPNRLRTVLNLGVGGDKIQNVAYRMIGDDAKNGATASAANHPSNGAVGGIHNETLEGYLEYLVEMKSIKLWVVQAGTNNLHHKHGLSDGDVEDLSKLLRSLLRIPSNGNGEKNSRILLTGLFPRTDISDDKIDLANKKLEAMVGKINEDPDVTKDAIVKNGEGTSSKVARVVYLAPSVIIGNKNEFFVDKVHLNAAGYRQWLKLLVPWVMGLLNGMNN